MIIAFLCFHPALIVVEVIFSNPVSYRVFIRPLDPLAEGNLFGNDSVGRDQSQLVDGVSRIKGNLAAHLRWHYPKQIVLIVFFPKFLRHALFNYAALSNDSDVGADLFGLLNVLGDHYYRETGQISEIFKNLQTDYRVQTALSLVQYQKFGV